MLRSVSRVISASLSVFQQAGTGAVARTVQDKLRDVVSVRDFGMVCDGATVETTKFQAALASVGASGGTLNIPRDAKIVTGSVTLPPNVRIEAELAGLDATADNINFNFEDLGSAIYTLAGATITLSAGAAIDRCLLSPVSIKGVAQENADDFVDTAITVAGLGAAVTNCLILGYEKAIASNGYSRLRIEWNAIDANNGIDVAASFDSSRIKNNHLWPYLTVGSFWNSGADYASRDKTKLYRSGTGLKLTNGSDDTQVDGNLTYGHLVGYELQVVNSVNFGINWSDHPHSMDRADNIGVWLRNNVADIQGQTFFIYGSKDGMVCDMSAGEQARFDLVHVEAVDRHAVIVNGGDLAIDNLEAENAGDNALVVASTASRVSIPNYRFVNIGAAEPVALLVAGCTTDKVQIGKGYYDGAGGSTLFGTNTLSPPTIASADPLPLTPNASTFFVSGTTGFGAITGGWAGRRVTLIFQGVLTVFDGAVINMTGDFTTSANDVLEIEFDGAQWLEIGRAAN